ncbi:hypothetical protein AYI68_g5278 [Smittium mucronatum]|uniref:Uncharacterized protein n=1 Tax=Smittium mucronatum TaxID=133383 RepID=A0A1R0GUS2_9FUNG|nr:hypothetical protein AYI68_g5278 [Smittium mucronatum]
MKKRKIRIEKTIILTTKSSSEGLPAEYLREKSAIYRPKDPPGIVSSRCMTEVTCSQELSCFVAKNISLKLLSSYSEPNPNRINKI